VLTRRLLIAKALKLSAGLALRSRTLPFAQADAVLTLKLGNAMPVNVPDNFMGLGYEMSSVAAAGLLSAKNHRYLELIRGLGARGVLRVGGIVADYSRYEPNGKILAERQDTVIAHGSLKQLARFLRRIGWTAIWSVNFAKGSLQDAVAEASAVSAALGSQLLALEIGNEVENYGLGRTPFRTSAYDYETYRKEYSEWHAAILKAVPGLHFAAPDTASSVDWVERMAQDAKGDVQLLTTHYYRNGQSRGSAEQLLVPDPRLEDVLTRLRDTSQNSGIPWRMCETNSFSGGGLPGVSDTFIGALWTLDFMLLLAQSGCAGVNIETGVNQMGFVSSYSPIQDNGNGVNSAGIPYYGMLAFANAMSGCHEALPIEFDTWGVNLTAYALGTGGKPRSVILVNRERTRDIPIDLAGLGLGSVAALRLTAPSAESTTGITLGGAAVDTNGHWKARTNEHVSGSNVMVAAMSAVVLSSTDQYPHA
jgi:hypothetical protein